MTDQQHPINPPPELIRKWNEEAATAPMADQRYIATQAARWGADQELEACVGWMESHFHGRKEWGDALRDARRPKPPSLVRRALHILGTHGDLSPKEHDTIRQALEHLDD